MKLIENIIDNIKSFFCYNKYILKQDGWVIVTYGKIDMSFIEYIKKTIELTMNDMNCLFKKPEIHISTGDIILNNDIIPALLEITPNKKAIMRLSIESVLSTDAFLKGISKEAIICAFASHETVHYVQFCNGENMDEIDSPNREIRLTKLKNHPLEIQANKIAENIILRMFNEKIEFVE